MERFGADRVVGAEAVAEGGVCGHTVTVFGDVGFLRSGTVAVVSVVSVRSGTVAGIETASFCISCRSEVVVKIDQKSDGASGHTRRM